MLKRVMGTALISLSAAVATTIPAAALPDTEKIERLERDEANGGPWIEGGRSPFQTRYKVCNELPTPVHQSDTSRRIKVLKTVCWFE